MFSDQARAALSGTHEYAEPVGALMPEQPAPLHDLDQDLPVVVTDGWRASFPGARVGLLRVENVANQSAALPLLREEVQRIEARLRQRFASADRASLAGLPTLQAYQRHYRAFGQTYHVLRQLESVALTGKPLASPSGLVLAMFAAELDSLLLTAGHDLEALRPPIMVDRSMADERFVGLGGREQVVRAGDMLMRDQGGIISAVVYGPDQRTRLVDHTRRALFTTYAPAGIGADELLRHLDQLALLVRLAAPQAEVRLRALYPD
jgi:DNA/RNA-binding domain of Phe-tRNA-synthetase-like protein